MLITTAWKHLSPAKMATKKQQCSQGYLKNKLHMINATKNGTLPNNKKAQTAKKLHYR